MLPGTMTTLPTSSKDYSLSAGMSVGNFSEVRDFLFDGDSYRTYGILFRDNRKRLPSVLGPRGAQWTGNNRWDVWKIEVTPRTWMFILSGVTGSSLEVDGDYENDVHAIIDTLKALASKLNALPP